MKEFFETFGSICSILGLLISILVLIKASAVKSEVEKLRTKYIFKKRVNAHLKSIDKLLREINFLFNDFSNNGHLLETCFGQCRAELESIKEKVEDTRVNKDINKLSDKLKKLLKSGISSRLNGWKSWLPWSPNKNSVWGLYVELSTLYTTISNLKKDLESEL